MSQRCHLIASLVLLGLSLSAPAAEGEWTVLLGEKSLDEFRGNNEGWIVAGGVRLDDKNPRKLVPVEPDGTGVFINGDKGRIRNLVTKETYQDVELEMEFLMGKGSNAGVKLNGMYEIQFLDSAGVPKEKLTGSHCGGIYPRATNKPRYHTTDKGVPPRVNAAKPAGEWQKLHLQFRSPRFNDKGEKVANAKFLKVVLNGQVIHEDVEVKHATGAVWNTKKELPRGPILLQSDHGPVAFRNVRVRRLP